jgi:peptide deformylase
MTLPIAQLGQPVLRQEAQEIPAAEISTPEFQHFIDEMLATCKEANGAGLAGPQVFADRRIFVARVQPIQQGEVLPEPEVFINPRIIGASEEQSLAWEGCLSFIELLVLVPRHRAIRVQFLNRRGESCTLDLAGFPARVVQHEYDHLDGILTLDRAPTTRYIIKASELEAAAKELEERREENDETEE